MTAVDLSSYVGLLAVCLLTLNILLGLLVSTDYQPQKHWPYRYFSAFKLHNWTGYVALCVAALHPLILLFSKTAGFHLFDIVFPIKSPTQPLENTVGAVALYCVVLVVITSYYRIAIGYCLWKRLHYFAYAAAPLFFIHSLLTDPLLKNSRFDPFDAEKVFVDICLVIVAVAIAWRIRYALANSKARKI